MSHIFISYSRQDIDFARYLRALFENQGFPVWMDEKRLSAGMDWWDEIETSIDACAAFVVIMSPDARESVFVRNEILRAIDRKKALFPVLLKGQHFGMLAYVQHEDMRHGLNATLSRNFAQRLRDALGLSNKRTVRVEVAHSPIQAFDADVVLLKLAPGSGGVDRFVSKLLNKANITIDEEALGEVGGYDIIETRGTLKARHVAYVRTEWVGAFGYRQVRQFAHRGLSVLGTNLLDTRHIAMTIHGVNTRLRLDEGESMLAQLAGLIDVLQAWQAPRNLEKITIVEIDEDRVQRIKAALQNFFDEVHYAQPASDTDWGYDLTFEREQTVKTPNAGDDKSKRYAIAIFPETPDLEDIFFYGIERPIHAMGLLCERLNPASDDDDEPDNIQATLERIQAASAVICDITEMSPLLYLQLGYAMGRDIPTALITRKDRSRHFLEEALVKYDKIWQLEERLGQWLRDKF